MRAEDRFGWLDDEAAENLLRGSAADGTSSCPPPRAKELAGVLDGLAESHQPDGSAGELPGEAEALAAFRSARARDCRGGRAGGRAGARSRRGRYMTRLSGTPLHVGLAMTVAGFALGGVAVAASNGVLPAPFGEGGQNPGVSGGRPPAVEPLESEGPPVDNASGGSSDRPSERRPGSTSPSESARQGGEGDGRTRDIAGAHRGNGDESETGRPPQDSPSTWPHLPTPDGSQTPDPGTWPPKPPSSKPGAPDPTVVVALCKAYEGDRIEQRKRRQLERVAGGPEQVERYCEEYGDIGGGGGGGTEGGDGGDGGIGIPEDPDAPGTPEPPEEPGGSDGGADGGGSGGSGGAAGGAGGSDGGTDGGGSEGGASGSGGTDGGSDGGSDEDDAGASGESSGGSEGGSGDV